MPSTLTETGEATRLSSILVDIPPGHVEPPWGRGLLSGGTVGLATQKPTPTTPPSGNYPTYATKRLARRLATHPTSTILGGHSKPTEIAPKREDSSRSAFLVHSRTYTRDELIVLYGDPIKMEDPWDEFFR